MNNCIENIYPGVAKIEYSTIEVDGIFTVSLIITNYPDKISFLEVMDTIPKEIENRYSIYVYKQDEYIILKELTNVITTTNSEKKTVNKNQVDVDVLKAIEEKAKELRRKVQVENEGVYRICIYISVWDDTKQKAIEKARFVKNILYTKGIIAKVGNFRQKELYIANLPLDTLDEYLKNSTFTTVTTTALSYFFPYYNKYIIENGGIQFGTIDKKICILDMFSQNSPNANMLVLGSSGSGKSYFAHILIIRSAINGIMQRVIDPEGEYVYLARRLGGQIVEEDINIMYFSENYINKNKKGYIDKKINKLIEILNFKNIFTDEEKENLKGAMELAYKEKEITENQESLYSKKKDNIIFVNKKYIGKLEFPNLEDVFEKILDLKIKNNIIKKLKQIISDKTIASREIIRKENIVIYNLKELQENKRETYIQFYLNSIKEEYGNRLQIYIDELWKCIGYGRSYKIIYEITDMFKSIRKHNAGIIAITQDISDLFEYENGAFAKSILNNSYLKVYFKMEYADIEILEKIGFSDRKKLAEIKKLNKGTAIITRGWTNFCLEITSDENEKNYIGNGGNVNEETFDSDG